MTDFVGPLPASNYMAARQGHLMRFGGASDPSFIVIHTMVGTVASADSRFKNPTQQVSAHYGIGMDGRVVQWVNEDDTAFHSGSWDMNLNSIGIEHEDDGDYNGQRPDVLYEASSDLVRDICNRYGIPITRQWIIKHCDVPGASTGCPDALDIDRIVTMAAGTRGLQQPGPAQPQGDTYSVQTGDTLSAIAARLFGDAGRWQEIYNANRDVVGGDPNSIQPGMVLTIPSSMQPAAPTPPTYTVQSGDTLSGIAASLYGDASRWQEIYSANQGIIGDDPNSISPGEVLTIP